MPYWVELGNTFGGPIYVLFYYVAQDVFYGKVDFTKWSQVCEEFFNLKKKLSQTKISFYSFRLENNFSTKNNDVVFAGPDVPQARHWLPGVQVSLLLLGRSLLLLRHHPLLQRLPWRLPAGRQHPQGGAAAVSSGAQGEWNAETI